MVAFSLVGETKDILILTISFCPAPNLRMRAAIEMRFEQAKRRDRLE